MKNCQKKLQCRSAGFTVMELMLAVMAFLIILMLVLMVAAKQQSYRRDVTRTAAVQQMQKALALYQSAKEFYPEFQGCITGDDDLTKELIAGNYLLEASAAMRDPKWPKDITKCLYYKGSGSEYSIRYFLETDRAQSAGEHYAMP